ncbi:PREDICTED: extensin-like [Papilio xuthus]|uniref:Extensin-like n=1 Tax=Papilio xuthus TaxID=66420 RepID=A0AAJ6ZHV1_PAPXU
MRRIGNNMLVTVIVLSAVCGLVQSSGVSLAGPAPPAPVVTAASSQYFERTFNRLVAAQPAIQPVFPVAPPPQVIPVARAPQFIPVAPAHPVVPVAPAPVIPVAPVPNVFRVAPVPGVFPLQVPRPVFVQPATKDKPEPVAPTNPPQNAPTDPNVAIAIATANAAAPVATFLLPPYPFGPPPSFGFIPSSPTFVPEEDRENESTTETKSQTEATTTEKENETTTPVPTNIDNNFVQALPSNNNVNFREYLPPPFQLLLTPDAPQRQPQLPPVSRPTQLQPRPTYLPALSRPHTGRPQKVKTSVEVVPVPLTYIAPPPLKKHHPVKLVKVTKHIHTFIPAGKIIIRPISHRVHPVGNAVYAKAYVTPISGKKLAFYRKTISKRSKTRDIEPTTLRPLYKSS